MSRLLYTAIGLVVATAGLALIHAQERQPRKFALRPEKQKGGTLVIDLGGGVKMELVRIKAGSFMMGSPGSDDQAYDWEKPQHKVKLTHDYYLGKYPVTQEQYEKVTGKNPSYFSAGGAGKGRITGMDTKRFPVEQVSWEDARAFCEILSRLSRRKCDLPTEAQWEYACRAGSGTRYSFGDSQEDLKEYAWHQGNSGSRTHEVGKKQPNSWGLYDMHGNVWQWCADRYEKNYYKDSPKEDPQGPTSDTSRVLRGGSWYNHPRTCRSAHRAWVVPSNHSYIVGFRVSVRLDP